MFNTRAFYLKMININIIYCLILIRFRKYLSKGDNVAILLITAIYILVAYFSYLNFEKITNWFLLLFLDPVLYHYKRKDLDLLKSNRDYIWIIFLEYLIYVFPFFVVLLLKKQFIIAFLILCSYKAIVMLPRLNVRVQKLPFQIFDPFWHIVFRRYRIIYWLLPLLFLFSFMGFKHNNINLQYFVVISVGVVCCLPSFERERKEEINFANYNSADYLTLQLKNTLTNTLFLLGSTSLILFLVFFDANLLFFSLILILITLFNVLLKYVFFYSSFKQQIFFSIVLLSFGIILLMAPFLYKRAINNLNEIKNVKD